MSASRFKDYPYGRCPCGQGEIIEREEDLDYPGNPRHEFRLDCPICRQKLTVAGDKLVERSADEKASQSSVQLRAAKEELEQCSKAAIDEIVKSLFLSDYKAEYKALNAAKLCDYGPIKYPRRRGEGDPASKMCDPLKNVPWILKTLGNPELAGKIKKLTADVDQHEAEHEAARQAREKTSKPIESFKKSFQ